jgi:hypothetical protein
MRYVIGLLRRYIDADKKLDSTVLHPQLRTVLPLRELLHQKHECRLKS